MQLTCFPFHMHLLHKPFPLSEMICVGFLEHYGGVGGNDKLYVLNYDQLLIQFSNGVFTLDLYWFRIVFWMVWLLLDIKLD